MPLSALRWASNSLMERMRSFLFPASNRAAWIASLIMAIPAFLAWRTAWMGKMLSSYSLVPPTVLFPFDFIYGDRHKENPAAPYMTDPLVGGAAVNDKRLNTQIQYNDHFANNTLNVLGRLFLGQYRYDQPGVYSGEKTVSTGPSNWHGAELRLLSTAISIIN